MYKLKYKLTSDIKIIKVASVKTQKQLKCKTATGKAT